MEFHENDDRAIIKVIGVGGGGINALNNMIEGGLVGVDFIAVDTDSASLEHSLAECKIGLRGGLPRGRRSGVDSNTGFEAAREGRENIKAVIGKADLVFIVACMGASTGSGAAPVIAQIAKELGALTVGVVTTPFYFEGKKLVLTAENGLTALSPHTHSVITIPNDRLIQLTPRGAKLADCLKTADEILHSTVRAISDIIVRPGLIGIDFADIKTVLEKSNSALMGQGKARGISRARDAAIQAVTSPLLGDFSIGQSSGVFANITGSSGISMEEIGEVCGIIQEQTHEDVQCFFGAIINESLGDELSVTIIVAGVGELAEGQSISS